MKLSIYGKDNAYGSGQILVEGEAFEMLEHAKRPCAYPFQQSHNSQRYENILRRPEGSEFSGGTYESLFELPDMTPFAIAKEKLRNSELTKKLSAKFSNINRRRRILSEHDGEWEMSRQWEIQPFYNAKRQQTPHRIIDINCHLNVSCGVSAQEISSFGCMVWAINDVIESCGINTNINIVCDSAGVDEGGNLYCRVKLNLKKPGEYINPSNIARCLTSNFYRRVIFSWDVIACDFGGGLTSGGLGTPCRIPDIIKFENGVLNISSETIRVPNDKNVQEELVKAIIGDNK